MDEEKAMEEKSEQTVQKTEEVTDSEPSKGKQIKIIPVETIMKRFNLHFMNCDQDKSRETFTVL